MPRYKVRHENDRGDYRETFLVADSPEAAEAVVLGQELGLVNFDASAIPPVDDDSYGSRLEELEAKLDGGDPKVVLHNKDRAHWFAHHQETAYRIVSVEEEDRA